jgi:hypothetical protein
VRAPPFILHNSSFILFFRPLGLQRMEKLLENPGDRLRIQVEKGLEHLFVESAVHGAVDGAPISP